MELMRSDLSVQQEDRLRAAFSDPADALRGQRPGDDPRVRTDIPWMFLARRFAAGEETSGAGGPESEEANHTTAVMRCLPQS
jgi:hypothetical protein